MTVFIIPGAFGTSYLVEKGNCTKQFLHPEIQAIFSCYFLVVNLRNQRADGFSEDVAFL